MPQERLCTLGEWPAFAADACSANRKRAGLEQEAQYSVAPTNLLIPPYSLSGANALLIGADETTK